MAIRFSILVMGVIGVVAVGGCGAAVDDSVPVAAGGDANTGLVPGVVNTGAEAAEGDSQADTGVLPGSTDIAAEAAEGASANAAAGPPAAEASDSGAAPEVATGKASARAASSDSMPSIDGVDDASREAVTAVLGVTPHDLLSAVSLGMPPAHQEAPDARPQGPVVADGKLWLYARLRFVAADSPQTAEAYWQARLLAERLVSDAGSSAPFGFEVQQPDGELLMGGLLTLFNGEPIGVPTKATFEAASAGVSSLASGAKVDRAGDWLPVVHATVETTEDVPQVVVGLRSVLRGPYLLQIVDPQGQIVFAQGVTGSAGEFTWKAPELRG